VKPTAFHHRDDALCLFPLDFGKPADQVAHLGDIHLLECQRKLCERAGPQWARDGPVRFQHRRAATESRSLQAYGLRGDLQGSASLEALDRHRGRTGPGLDAQQAVADQIELDASVARRGGVEHHRTADPTLDPGIGMSGAYVGCEGFELKIGHRHGHADRTAATAGSFPLDGPPIALRIDEACLDRKAVRAGEAAAPELGPEGFECQEQGRREWIFRPCVDEHDGRVAQLQLVGDDGFLEDRPHAVLEADQGTQQLVGLGGTRLGSLRVAVRVPRDRLRAPVTTRRALDSKPRTIEHDAAEAHLTEEQRLGSETGANPVDLEARRVRFTAPDEYVRSLEADPEANGEVHVSDRHGRPDELRQPLLGVQTQRLGCESRCDCEADRGSAEEDSQHDENASDTPRHGRPLIERI
jgi:hypothetical protein